MIWKQRQREYTNEKFQIRKGGDRLITKPLCMHPIVTDKTEQYSRSK